MSVTTEVPSRLKASDGRRIAPRKSACSARYSRTAAFCLSSVKWLVTRARMPPGFRASTRLGEEEIVQRQLLAAIVELHVGERHVADHGVDAALGQLACRGSSRCGCRPRGAGLGRCGRRWNRARRR